MAFRIDELTDDSIEDAVAYWLYSEDDGWERWRLVPGSQVLSPGHQTLRVELQLEDETFELALIQRGPRLAVKFDDREDPDQELPARLFEAPDETIITFVYKDETVFLHLELAT
jgi:hypothetical protein